MAGCTNQANYLSELLDNKLKKYGAVGEIGGSVPFFQVLSQRLGRKLSRDFERGLIKNGFGLYDIFSRSYDFPIVSIYNSDPKDIKKIEVYHYLHFEEPIETEALDYAKVPVGVISIAFGVIGVLRSHGIDVCEKNLHKAEEKLRVLIAKIERRKQSGTTAEEFGIDNAVSLDELLSRR